MGLKDLYEEGGDEALIVLSACILTFVALLGHYGRRSGHQVLRLLLEAADVLSLAVFSTVISRVKTDVNAQSEQKEKEDDAFSLVVVWAVFLLIIFIDLVVVSDNPFRNQDQWKMQVIVRLVQAAWVAYFIQISWYTEFSVPLYMLWSFGIAKLANRVAAFVSANQSLALGKNAKLVSDYMIQQQQQQQQQQYDTTTMSGYAYLFMGEEKQEIILKETGYHLQMTHPEELVTIDKLWPFLGNDQQLAGHRDLCLSFALFKLLRRRFSGYTLAECGTQKALDFVLHGLLGPESSSGSDDNTTAAGGRRERAFRVIEAELGFLNDYFYSSLPLNYYAWFSFTNFILFPPLLASCVWLAVRLGYAFRYSLSDCSGRDCFFFVIDEPITFFVIGVVVFIQVWEFITYVASDWFKVILLCIFFKKPSWQRTAVAKNTLRLVCRLRLCTPWDGKIGQYSVLANSDPSHLLSRVLNRVTLGYVTEAWRISLSTQVERAILSSLRSNGGTLCRGTSSLQRNGVSQQLLDEYCGRHQSDTEVILVWHIATVLCGFKHRLDRDDRNSIDKGVASDLSRYAAYLVAHIPDLLPDIVEYAQHVLETAVVEARPPLKVCGDRQQLYDHVIKMGGGSTGDSSTSVVRTGARLASQLMEERRTRGGEAWMWKVLAEFWAELLLYLAPSSPSNVNIALAHARRLRKGGELITHIWALLSHAGIVNRSQSVLDAEGPSPTTTGIEHV